jgi:hypothetical protein
MRTKSRKTPALARRFESIVIALLLGIGVGLLFRESVLNILRDSIGKRDIFWLVLAVFATASVGFFSSWIVAATRRVARAKRVFLSYSHDSEEAAARIVQQLRKEGLKVWAAEEQLRPGEPIRPAVERAIADADVVLVLLSKILDETVRWEIDAALRRKIRIIPIRIEDGAPIPKKISNLATVSLSPDNDSEIERLAASVH